jgi:hypothetical protein
MTGSAISNLDYTLILQHLGSTTALYSMEQGTCLCMFDVKNRTTAISRRHKYHKYRHRFYAHAPRKGMKGGISSTSLLPTQKNPRSTPDSRVLFFFLNESTLREFPLVLANQPNRRQNPVLHCRSSRVAHGLFLFIFQRIN